MSKLRLGGEWSHFLDTQGANDGDEDVDRTAIQICVFTAFSDVP